jgi:hypothetical protein
MPRGGKFGYIHCQGLNSESLAQILAHELMHGQFLLRHTFDDKYANGLKQGVNPTNLMDYKGGRHIAKWQWDQIYDPAITTSLIKYDEEGELVVTIITYLTKFGVNTAINICSELLVYRLTDPDVHSWEDAWNKVDCWRAVVYGAVDLINVKKIKIAAEFVAEFALCLKDKENIVPEDFGNCGLTALADLVLEGLTPKQKDLAVLRLGELVPDNTSSIKTASKKQVSNLTNKLAEKLTNYPNLNKKLTELGELKDKFIADFEELADDKIILFEQNTKFVDAWKRFAQCQAADELRKNIGAIEALATDKTKKKRPDPSTYLSKEYIEAHMKKFEDGAAFIKTKQKFENHSEVGHSDSFVSNIENIERVVREAKKYNTSEEQIKYIEKKLGFDKGDLGSKTEEIYIIYLKPEQIKNPRIPDGNAKGANEFWIPGGCTASEDAMGIPEIVIDCSELSTDLFDQNYNNLLPLSNFK